ncbi:hypothetical protein SUGI_1236070 [Cryptomeria japonica]|uniref:Uncharacterized protein n=1 Tax=Cryptomeria japonica TaxID=3369 RepID=A0AAD3RMJ8_CRYJA|nr:hypothetical protein SUGI_1236070 [Cryptomeria japonica]
MSIDAGARLVGALGCKNLAPGFIDCDGHGKSPDCYAGAHRESLCGLGMDSTCGMVRQCRDRVPAMNVLDSSWAFWDRTPSVPLYLDRCWCLKGLGSLGFINVHHHLSSVRDAAGLLNAMRALSENLYPASTQTSLAEWFGTGSRSNTSLLWPPRRFDSSPRLAFGLLGGFCPIRNIGRFRGACEIPECYARALTEMSIGFGMDAIASGSAKPLGPSRRIPRLAPRLLCGEAPRPPRNYLWVVIGSRPKRVRCLDHSEAALKPLPSSRWVLLAASLASHPDCYAVRLLGRLGTICPLGPSRRIPRLAPRLLCGEAPRPPRNYLWVVTGSRPKRVRCLDHSEADPKPLPSSRWVLLAASFASHPDCYAVRLLGRLGTICVSDASRDKGLSLVVAPSASDAWTIPRWPRSLPSSRWVLLAASLASHPDCYAVRLLGRLGTICVSDASRDKGLSLVVAPSASDAWTIPRRTRSLFRLAVGSFSPHPSPRTPIAMRRPKRVRCLDHSEADPKPLPSSRWVLLAASLASHPDCYAVRLLGRLGTICVSDASRDKGLSLVVAPSASDAWTIPRRTRSLFRLAVGSFSPHPSPRTPIAMRRPKRVRCLDHSEADPKPLPSSRWVLLAASLASHPDCYAVRLLGRLGTICVSDASRDKGLSLVVAPSASDAWTIPRRTRSLFRLAVGSFSPHPSPRTPIAMRRPKRVRCLDHSEAAPKPLPSSRWVLLAASFASHPDCYAVRLLGRLGTICVSDASRDKGLSLVVAPSASDAWTIPRRPRSLFRVAVGSFSPHPSPRTPIAMRRPKRVRCLDHSEADLKPLPSSRWGFLAASLASHPDCYAVRLLGRLGTICVSDASRDKGLAVVVAPSASGAWTIPRRPCSLFRLAVGAISPHPPPRTTIAMRGSRPKRVRCLDYSEAALQPLPSSLWGHLAASLASHPDCYAVRLLGRLGTIFVSDTSRDKGLSLVVAPSASDAWTIPRRPCGLFRLAVGAISPHPPPRTPIAMRRPKRVRCLDYSEAALQPLPSSRWGHLAASPTSHPDCYAVRLLGRLGTIFVSDASRDKGLSLVVAPSASDAWTIPTRPCGLFRLAVGAISPHPPPRTPIAMR